MIPSIYKNPKIKLLLLNKLNIPMDVLNIIKDFAFYNSEKMPFIKNISAKKREPHLIKLAWSRTNLPPWRREERFPGEPTGIITETSSRWLFGFTYDNIPSFNLITPVGLDIFNLQMQGENCIQCGEYKYLCYTYKRNIRPKINICFCQD